MTIKHICCLLEFCLKNTYFKFNGEFYEQKEGAAKGSPISPVVPNLFMEDLEIKVISTTTTPPKIWRRFVDDTFTIIKKKNRNSFLQHLNSVHPNIKFTCEKVKEDGSMPFLDILVTPAEDGSLKASVFRKPIHTDLYLHWDSHLNIPSKYSVAGTLFHRATTICSDPTLLQEEEQHLFKALKKCKYPIWAINRAKLKARTQIETNKEEQTIKRAQETTTVRTCIWWFHIIKASVRESRKHVANMGYRYISKEDSPSKASLWLPRTMILLTARVASYMHTNAMKKGVEKNTLENMAEPLQKGSKTSKAPFPNI